MQKILGGQSTLTVRTGNEGALSGSSMVFDVPVCDVYGLWRDRLCSDSSRHQPLPITDAATLWLNAQFPSLSIRHLGG